ncbi:MAG: hypothetical protein M3297_01910 [Thermoproteota archaeon]|jgi:hypothetical protein|nr:hypothetical protein [Thermoproteota archaeon]
MPLDTDPGMLLSFPQGKRFIIYVYPLLLDSIEPRLHAHPINEKILIINKVIFVNLGIQFMKQHFDYGKLTTISENPIPLVTAPAFFSTSIV